MPVRSDPEDTETNALFDYAGSFAGKRVLEIGCGDGRLTWRYADRAARVVGIDPDEEDIAIAQEDTPPSLRGRVEFRSVGIQDYEPDAPFDVALLSWAL